MTKLIVGLGNPGEKYAKNRHNVGYMMLDYINNVSGDTLHVSGKKKFKYDKYSNSEIAELVSDEEKIILVKPQTYMNNSGVVVKKILSHVNCPAVAKARAGRHLSNVYIVHDDLDIPLGQYKIQLGKGPKLHNGIESIENHLKSKDFYRIRIGVDNREPERRIAGEKYVLQDFSSEEFDIVLKLFDNIWKDFISSGILDPTKPRLRGASKPE